MDVLWVGPGGGGLCGNRVPRPACTRANARPVFATCWVSGLRGVLLIDVKKYRVVVEAVTSEESETVHRIRRCRGEVYLDISLVRLDRRQIGFRAVDCWRRRAKRERIVRRLFSRNAVLGFGHRRAFPAAGASGNSRGGQARDNEDNENDVERLSVEDYVYWKRRLCPSPSLVICWASPAPPLSSGQA